MQVIPFEINEKVVQCFHYKDTMVSFLTSAGVPKNIALKYRDEYKFVWAKKLLNDLAETEEGQILQRKIVTELCKLRNLPDSNVNDRDAGINALRDLKETALKHQIAFEEGKEKSIDRLTLAKEKAKLAEERGVKLFRLRDTFFREITSANRQRAGFDLEDLLQELFSLNEIEYSKPYKTETQQIDGHFKFDGFHYLVEAKWRSDQPSEGEIGGFQRKVTTKFESTRGCFVSVSGYRNEVIQQFSGGGARIIFFNGEDLVHILEGRIDLKDALSLKIERASKYGEVCCRLT